MKRASKERLIKLLIGKDNFYKELHLIDNIDLIKKISNKPDFPKTFFFDVKKIHEILYEFDEIIDLNSNLIEEANFSFYYYLVSLIQMKSHIINYEYNFDYIQKIVNQISEEQNQDNKKINVLIKAKKILVLIENFKGFNEENLEEIDKIVKINESLISNNMQCLTEINPNMTENYIKIGNINEIYAEIIISLIKNDKLADFKYASNIMDEMEMENIDINEFMYKKLEYALNSDEINNKYAVENLDDLNNFEKINFHYILLKKIFKNSIYIYQINFLLKTRNNIIKLLKQGNIIFNINEYNDEIKRMEYIIKKYCDSDYYFINLDENISTKVSGFKSGDLPKKKALKDNIIEFEKIIGSHEETAIEIKELKNGLLVSFGTDNKLIIYNKNFSVKIEEKEIDDRIHHVLEIDSQRINQSYIKLLLCTYSGVYLNEINLDNNSSKMKRYNDCGGEMCLEIKNNNDFNYIICNENGIFKYSHLFSNIFLPNKKALYKKPFRGGYKLNNNLVAFSSNKDSSNKKNRLIFININSNEIIKKIKDNNNKMYSFIKSSNGLLLIKNENKSLKKIFLAACKKYSDNQKNGILTVISLFDETDEMSEEFYPTGNFEVYCFCQLSEVKDTGKILDSKTFIKTNYFLVGGYDQRANCGLIKLYKAKFDSNAKNTNIKFVQDISIKKNNNVEENISNNEKLNESYIFKGFSGAISSIVQSILTGNILATCDGKVYLFTPPNLEKYLSEDENDNN